MRAPLLTTPYVLKKERPSHSGSSGTFGRRAVRVVMGGKVKHTPEELVRLIRQRLGGRYAAVPISIERSGTSWIAVVEIDSLVTRDRIQAVVRRLRELYDLA
jgi:hypothetical protein